MSTPAMAAYLLERIAEDEQIARYNYTAALLHTARHDPARVIADCEAKRTIVRHCQEVLTHHVFGDHVGRNLTEGVLQRFVQVYADRPDFPSEWLPEVAW